MPRSRQLMACDTVIECLLGRVVDIVIYFFFLNNSSRHMEYVSQHYYCFFFLLCGTEMTILCTCTSATRNAKFNLFGW